ncbi:MAG: hypothetical protein B6I20_14465 [Bacteroidetes bacterium 4572_117]|nr:MAG: hypothetical protein B6I20_14465 [Bacteroidetes bacterium 4572_117]
MKKILILIIGLAILSCSEKNEQNSNETQTKNSQTRYQFGGQIASDSPTDFNVGKNKIWFFSEGTKVVGNLYVLENFNKADKLPIKKRSL